MTRTLSFLVTVTVNLTDDAATLDPVQLVQEEIESAIASVDYVDSVSVEARS